MRGADQYLYTVGAVPPCPPSAIEKRKRVYGEKPNDTVSSTFGFRPKFHATVIRVLQLLLLIG